MLLNGCCLEICYLEMSCRICVNLKLELKIYTRVYRRYVNGPCSCTRVCRRYVTCPCTCTRVYRRYVTCPCSCMRVYRRYVICPCTCMRVYSRYVTYPCTCMRVYSRYVTYPCTCMRVYSRYVTCPCSCMSNKKNCELEIWKGGISTKRSRGESLKRFFEKSFLQSFPTISLLHLWS